MLMGRVAKTQVEVRRRMLGYRQFQVKAFIDERVVIDGIAPSVSMICERFDMDRGNVSRLIASLKRRGLVVLGDGYHNRQQRRMRLL